MKSVLISIQPKWCHRIIDGEKKIEVRKTKPKLATPFKVYIYCSAGSYDWRKDIWATAYFPPSGECTNMSQMVIGEFVCDDIKTYPADDFVGAEGSDGTIITEPKDGEFAYWIPEEKETCLPYEKILAYGNGKTLYGWHISDLKIYDNPRELSEFWAYNEELHKRYDSERDFCCYDATNEHGESLTDCGDAYNNILNCYRCWEEWSGWCHHVTRPPQSWCYVEELQNV